MSNLSDTIIDYINKIVKMNGSKSYDVTGKVVRTEDDMAFVQFENSVVETPVEMTISVKPGDSVKVRVSDRKAWIIGNSTVPPTGDAKAIEAATQAGLAKLESAAATKAAEIADRRAKTAFDEATAGVDRKMSAYDDAVQQFTNLIANAYGMYRSKIEDPTNPGSYIYALHNAANYSDSTFAMILNSTGLYMQTRDASTDPWTITAAAASDGSALVKSITANSAIIDELLSNDVTVTGALHSDDYIPAAAGASPPYSQAGMGIDFGEKEFEAENFAIDANGNMYAKSGAIGDWKIQNNYLSSPEYSYQDTEGNTHKCRVRIDTPREMAYGYDEEIILVERCVISDPDAPTLWFPVFSVFSNGDMQARDVVMDSLELSTTPLQISEGGTGADNVLDARSNLGLDKFLPVTLFTGDTQGDVSLIVTSNNYDILEIYYCGYNDANPLSTKILNPNGKTITLSIVEPGGDATSTRIRRGQYTIDGLTIRNNATNSGYVMVKNSGITHTLGTNVIHILRVDGYKK